MRILLAIRCFFRALFDARFADDVKKLTFEPGGLKPSAADSTAEELPPKSPAKRPAERKPAPVAPVRSDAIALLATLQREARFVDLVNESLDGYSDAQIGAAAREVLSDCGKVLDRIFAMETVVNMAEGESLEVPSGYDTGKFRLTGNVSEDPPVTGRLVHAGWRATQCELASWTGTRDAALVVAPAEVQVS